MMINARIKEDIFVKHKINLLMRYKKFENALSDLKFAVLICNTKPESHKKYY